MTPDEFKQLRIDANLTQQQLADLLSVGRSAVLHWEFGRRSISTVTEIAVRVVTANPNDPISTVIEAVGRTGADETKD